MYLSFSSSSSREKCGKGEKAQKPQGFPAPQPLWFILGFFPTFLNGREIPQKVNTPFHMLWKDVPILPVSISSVDIRRNILDSLCQLRGFLDGVLNAADGGEYGGMVASLIDVADIF